MRITLNLASRPYVDLAPYYRRLRLWMAALAVLAVPLFLLTGVERRHARAARADEEALLEAIRRLEATRAGYRAEMQQPANAEVLTQSDFLNQLFRAKAFSWTAVMMDLERVLPAGLEVTDIEPAMQKDGHLMVRMRVQGPRDRAVSLVRNLERSRVFLLPRLTSETAATSAGAAPRGGLLPAAAPAANEVNFELLADYNPLPPAAPKADGAGRTGKTEKTARGGARSAAGKTATLPMGGRPRSAARPAAGAGEKGEHHGG